MSTFRSSKFLKQFYISNALFNRSTYSTTSAKEPISYKLITEKQFPFETIRKFILENFVPNDPIGQSIKLDTSDFNEFLTFLINDVYNDGLGVAAVASGDKLAGLSLSTIQRLNHPKIEFKGKLKFLMELLDASQGHVNLHELFQQSQIAKINVLSVSDKFYRRGIGAQAIAETIKHALKKNLNCIYAEAIGISSARLHRKLGFVDINYYPYFMHKCSNGEKPFDHLEGGIRLMGRFLRGNLQDDPLKKFEYKSDLLTPCRGHMSLNNYNLKKAIETWQKTNKN